MTIGELNQQVHAARTAADVLAALARGLWARANGLEAACPDSRVPAAGALAGWLPDCPPAAWARAASRAGGWSGPLLGEPVPSPGPPGQPGDLDGSDQGSPRSRTYSRLEVALAQGTFPRLDEAPASSENIPAGEVAATIEAIHSRWIALGEGRRGKHPLGPLVEAWQAHPLPTEPFRPSKRASLARLQRVSADEAKRLPHLPGIRSLRPAGPRQLSLPGMGPGVRGCPSWVLNLWDRMGGQSLARGRGAPWPLRLFVGALLHLPVGMRDGNWRTLRFPTAEVIGWLHPNGWANRRRDWQRFPDALSEIGRYPGTGWLSVPGLGSVLMMTASVVPERRDDPIVEFTARIPASAGPGARLDWTKLCEYGADSARLYRAYLAVAALMDASARKGQPVTLHIAAPVLGSNGKPVRRKGGRIVRDPKRQTANPAARFVRQLTAADLARLIGFDGKDKRRRRDAVLAFKRLSADGVLELVEEGRGRGRTYRLFGPARQPLELPESGPE